MNVHFKSNHSKEVETVSSRVQNTKKEIEQLKNELEKLIHIGAQPKFLNLNTDSKPEIQESQPIQPVSSYHEPPRHKSQSKKNVPTTQKKTEPSNTSPSKKIRTYNVAEARDYIKKQREKRAEQLKTQINVAENRLDLKKQKLKELHQKTIELVNKNVQMKRERSKSRDNEPPIRLDNTKIRSKSQEDIVKRRKFHEPPKPPPVCTKRQNSRDKLKIPQTKPVRSKSHDRDESQIKTTRQSRSRTKSVSASSEKPQSEPQKLKSTSSSRDVIDLRKKHHSSETDLNKKIISDSNKIYKTKKPTQVLEHCIMTDTCLKDSKETQTNQEKVPWMQPPPVLSYPYNFINTVKRKLQNAINVPRSCVDVGVQNSETPETGKTKSKEEIRELLIKSAKSDIRSFVSHGRPNLDLKLVENLELTPHLSDIKSEKDLVSKKLFLGYDSESDTSKNIPEISSESLGTISSKPKLTLDKVKDLKVQKSAKLNGDLKSIEQNSYSSDFQKESLSSKIKSNSSVISENIPLNSNSSTITQNDEFSKRSDIPSLIDFFNKNSRNESESQKTFKSLLTESKNSTSLSLKEPTVSLTVKTDKAKSSSNHKSSIKNLLMNTVTIRSPSDDTNIPTLEDKQEPPESISTQNKTSRSITESIPESLKQSSTHSSLDKQNNALKTTDSFSLKEPSASLVLKKDQSRAKSQIQNITLRTPNNNNVNEVHLKFEAEVRLLNDFNESFKQFMAVEKAFENLKTQNESNFAMTKVLQNVDTQTSIIAKSSGSTEKSIQDIKSNSINFSRGTEDLNEISKSVQNSTFSSDWNLSNLNETSVTNISTGEDEISKLSLSGIENCNLKTSASILSLNIFDQLIKDEDTRIQQLKAIIKIREQALLDRTKSELVWLEIQKKQLIETGKLEEASLLKKKQRGIILKHEQERNEIKNLKQMQKEASEHRKNTLKQQRNLIKTQLSTDNMLSKITVKKRKERRSMGPLRVVQSCSESIQSETSYSLKSSGIEDVLSITSKSVRVSEESELDLSKVMKGGEVLVTNAKRTLLMREAALEKRRKAAEELLRWHQKLLDEERKIRELEAAATSVVKKAPEDIKYKFNGKQLNQLWKKMTGSDEKKYIEDKAYVMSQISLERLCKTARQYSNKNKKTKNSEQSNENSEDEKFAKKFSDDVNYSSAFEPESVQEIISQEEKTKISSISELIDNFSKIEDEISTFGKKSEDIVSLKESSQSIEQKMTPNQITEPEEIQTIEENIKEKLDMTIESEFSNITENEDKSSIIATTEKISPKDTIEDQISTELEDQQKPISTIADDNSPKCTNEDISELLEEAKISSSLDQQTPEDIPSVEEVIQQKIEIETPESIPEVSLKEQITDKSETSDISNVEENISVIEEVAILNSSKSATQLELISEKLIEESTSKLEPSEKSVDDIEETEKTNSNKEISDGLDVTPEEIVTEKPESSTKESADYTPISDKPKESVSEIATTEDHESTSELLDLEEALESASKIEESLSKLNDQLNSAKQSEISTEKSAEELSKKSPQSDTTSSISSISDDKTPKKNSTQIDVKKRVSEILADAGLSRGDKSPRLQDLYVTAYDVGGSNFLETNDSLEEGRQLPTDIFGSEAEELWRKQLAIEQEIKQIELQQKEQIPYMFMREIPNKPPPPYTPPSSLSSLPPSILPSDIKELNEIASYSSKVLYKAYQNNNFDKVKFSENGFKLFSKIEVSKICAEYVFNICKDIAKDHYKQFETIKEPSWLALTKKPQLTKIKPSDVIGLEKLFNEKLKELFGFKKIQTCESAIIKWGRKKRDHVDEVLVIESQEEESQWTNFDKDELIVKNQVTEDIMKMLLDETASVFTKILSKKKSV